MEQGSPGPSSAAGGGVAGDGDRVGAFLALASEEAADGWSMCSQPSASSPSCVGDSSAGAAAARSE